MPDVTVHKSKLWLQRKREKGTAKKKKKLWGCSTSGRSPPDRFISDQSESRGEEAKSLLH